jgi:predicted dehydrogenase
MDKKYNVGIIGYSWAATAHIGAINATRQGQVTSVWSSRALDARELSERYGRPITVHSELEVMLADPDIHVVDVTSYPDQHAEQFCLAARNGKHVIVEKPLAIEWNQILEMKRAVAGARIHTCVCFECRYSSQFLATKAVLDAGLIGRVHYGEIDYYHGIGPWYGQYRWNTRRHQGGSALLTAGCHALDALLLCMNDDVEEVASYATQSASPIFQPYEYPTTSTTIVRFGNGSVGKCAAVVDCLQPYYFHIHLCGSEGGIWTASFTRRSSRGSTARRGAGSRCECSTAATWPIIPTRRSSRRSSTRSTPTARCRSPASVTRSPRTAS